MKYILKTQIYSNNFKTSVVFDEFKNALIAAEHLGNVLNNTMNLTRHSSCNGATNHCDYFADHYNELSIIIENEMIDAKRNEINKLSYIACHI